jgi:hypothetical protein
MFIAHCLLTLIQLPGVRRPRAAVARRPPADSFTVIPINKDRDSFGWAKAPPGRRTPKSCLLLLPTALFLNAVKFFRCGDRE